jgi:predicted PurR-regulated permease PerM
MNPSDEETFPAPQENRSLLLLLVAVSLALGWILLPFYGTLLWASIIALLFAPVYRRLLVRLRGRRTAAAVLTLLVAVVVAIVPFAVLSGALAREAMGVYDRVQSGQWNPGLYFHQIFDAMPAWVRDELDRFGLIDFDTLQRRLTAAVAQASQFIAARALGVGQDTFAFIVDLFITVYVAFFLIRDGASLVRALRRAIPLSAEHKKDLFDKFATVIRATVKGNLVVAALQGTLGGLAFWFLEVRAALLWGVLMAFLSLLPAVGAALVWLPVAIYFLVTGALWKAVALTAFGVLVIGLVDNLLRPVLVGKDTRMPDYVVMITTLGGMAAFGLNGFVLGPTIAAMFIAVWHIYGVTRSPGGP